MPKPRFFLDLKIDAFDKAPYDLEKVSLTPIIFTHGLAGMTCQYTGHMRELASFGYVMMGMDAHDGSCTYTENEDGEPILFDRSKDLYDGNFRAKQLAIRRDGLKILVDELFQNKNFLQEKLHFPNGVTLNLDNLTMAGHSFGGSAAITATVNDKRVKACVVGDPWFEPIMK